MEMPYEDSFQLEESKHPLAGDAMELDEFEFPNSNYSLTGDSPYDQENQLA
jgi:hypothetical protein